MVQLKTVVIVTNTATPGGGASQVAYDSALELANRGLSVVVFCAQNPHAGILEEAGVRVESLDSRLYLERSHKTRAAFDGIYDKAVFSSFEKLLGDLDHSKTVVHFHSWQHSLSCSPIDCAARLGFPVVLTAHEYSLVCPNMALFDFRRMEKCDCEPMGFACLCRSCDKRGYAQKLYRFLREVALRHVLRRARPTVVYISNFSRSVLEGKKALSDVVGRSEYLPDPVTGASLATSVPDLPQAGYYAFIGRLSPEKAPGLFCAAVRASGVRGVVVGDGELREQLEHEYPEVAFTGWLDKGGVAAVRGNAKGIVFPSHCLETAGLSGLEAMMFDGVPCIASEGCAICEYIEDGVTGLLFRDGDVESLADCLVELQDEPLHDLLCANIREKDFSKFTIKAHVDRLLEIYRRKLEETAS